MSDNIANGGVNAPKQLWDPATSKHVHKKLPIRRFIAHLQNKFNLDFTEDQDPYTGIDEYARLHRWSVLNTALFWAEVAAFCSIKYAKHYSRVIDERATITSMPQWFEGAKLNYAHNLLSRATNSKYADSTAIHWFREDFDSLDADEELSTAVRSLTFAELYSAVAEYTAAMKAAGVTLGDTVAGYMPNSVETVVAMLAAASLGAAWVSTSPDFGAEAVLARFAQVEPKLLFSIEAVIYKNKRHEHLNKLAEVVKGLPSLQRTVVVPYLLPESKHQQLQSQIESIPNAVLLSVFLSTGRKEDGSVPELKFVPVPFDHPLFIMFSSGTTGKPKCMVHSVGGTLLKHLCEHVLSNNMTSDDVIFFYSTCGWMMWNWLVTNLACGSAIVLYDGSPFERDMRSVFNIADKTNMSVLGMGAACFEHYEANQLRPGGTNQLTALRLVLATGSPLPAHTFEYIVNHIKLDVQIGSISGGTDIIGCFVGGTALRPVYAGECQCQLLGCDIQSWNQNGESVTDVGAELVVPTPFPSMPTRFLDDPDNVKYSAAYFDRFSGVWTHGDYININSKTGGITMLGRSDAVLNPAGVRFGPAEIYDVVESISGVADSLAIGQQRPDATERFVLFVKLAPGAVLDQSLTTAINTAIRQRKSPKFLPALIVACPDIPYTANNKKVELAVRRLVSGHDSVDNESALRNPQSLQFFRQWYAENKP